MRVRAPEARLNYRMGRRGWAQAPPTPAGATSGAACGSACLCGARPPAHPNFPRLACFEDPLKHTERHPAPRRRRTMAQAMYMRRLMESQEMLKRLERCSRTTEPGWHDEDGAMTCGAPGGDVIFFLHAACTTRKAFLPQMDALSDEFRCVSVDAEGHGVRQGKPWAMEASVSHVLRKMEEEAGERGALLVGLSLGGYTAMEVARRAPHRVRGIFISGCTYDFTGRTPPNFKHESIAKDYESKMLRGRTDLGTDFDAADEKDAIWRICITAPGTTPINMMHCFRDWDEHCARYQGGVAACRSPVVICVPEIEVDGALHNLANAQALASCCASEDVECLTVPKVGHLWNVEDARLYSHSVRQFARRAFALLRPVAAAPSGTPTVPPTAAASASPALASAETASARPPSLKEETWRARVAELQQEYFADDLEPPLKSIGWCDDQLVRFFDSGGSVVPGD